MTGGINGPWRAHWVWADGAATDTPRTVVALRRAVALDTLPRTAPARVCALSRYVLVVNGVEVARGPIRSNPRRLVADVVDIAPHLRPGDNVIGIIACRYGGATAWWLPPPAFANDLGNGAVVFEADLGDGPLVSDGTWSGTQLDGWTSTAGAGVSGRGAEVFDIRALPVDWAAPGGAAPAWPAVVQRVAMSVGEVGRSTPPSYPGGPLRTRPIGWPEPVAVALLPSSGDSRTTSRVVAGTVVVDAFVPAGERLSVRVAEFVDGAGVAHPGEHDASMVVVGDGTRRTIESLDIYGLQGAVVDAPAGAVVYDVSVRERLYPVAGDASFACSDDDLNRVYAVGRRTVSLCSLDAYVDCPTREQRAWVGDAVVHQMVDLTTNTDWRLAAWYPRLAASPRPDGMLPMAVAGEVEQLDFTVIPDWALHWVHAVHNLYRYTGDREGVAELLPVAEGVLRWFVPFTSADGLPRDVTGWVIVDWASVSTEGVCAALCGLWGRALLEFAEMSGWLGDAGRRDWALATHSRLREGFERLWSEPAQRYHDSLVGDELRPTASQHAQAAAIVGGLAPAQRWPRLVEVITDETHLVHAAFSAPDGPAMPNSGVEVGGAFLRAARPAPWWDVRTGVVRAQPFFRYVVHDALAVAGRADLIAAQCRDWVVALERSPTSWTETWYGGTISHGWSSTPTRDLVQRVLGVEPAEPGFTVASVQPHLGDLAWARGAVPTPHGLIQVDATRDGLTVSSPVPFVHDGVRHEAGKVSLAPAPA